MMRSIERLQCNKIMMILGYVWLFTQIFCLTNEIPPPTPTSKFTKIYEKTYFHPLREALTLQSPFSKITRYPLVLY